MERLDDGTPELLRRVLEEVNRAELRAYPMLIGHPWWSPRLKWLEVEWRPPRWCAMGRRLAGPAEKAATE